MHTPAHSAGLHHKVESIQMCKHATHRLCSFWKNFCACVRVCTTLRDLTVPATFFHSLPYLFICGRVCVCVFVIVWVLGGIKEECVLWLAP